MNNDLRNFLKKKILVGKNKIEKPEEKDDTKELEKKGLKQWMNNVRKQRNKHKQKKHQREQINIRRVIEHEKRKHEETKKEKRHGEKRENKNDEREQLRKSKNKESKHRNKADQFVFRGYFEQKQRD